MSNVHVTIDPERGWFGSLPAATQDFVMRKVTKAQTDRDRPVDVRVTGTGVMRARFTHAPSQARLDLADKLGRDLDRHFRSRNVTPWRGVSEGR